VKGAFTGADRDRKGLFRDCEGGSLLLDEIGETPKRMQSTLLRVLQERTVRPVGGNREEAGRRARRVRHQSRTLAELVKQGSFREDLYYPHSCRRGALPALRERLEDIPQLGDHFLGIFAARYKRDKGVLSRDAFRRLSEYDLARQRAPARERPLERVGDERGARSCSPRISTCRTAGGKWPHPASHPCAVSLRVPRAARSARASLRRARATVSEAPARRARANPRRLALLQLEPREGRGGEAAIPRRTFYRRLREYGIQ